MPFIDSTPALSPYKLREGTLQDDFCNMLIKNGWRKVLDFKKVVPITYYVNGRTSGKTCVARHTIMRNARGDLLGIAIAAMWDDDTSKAPAFSWQNHTQAEKDVFTTYLASQYDTRKSNTSIYFYMLEKLPNIQNNSNLLVTWRGTDDDLLRMALDIEVTDVTLNTLYNDGIVKIADPLVMQSPIVESTIRAKFLDNSQNYPYQETNWWADSEVSLRGRIDSNNIFVVLQADNTTMWDYNVVPIIPLYFGDIVPIDEGDPAIALFAGTVPTGNDKDTVSKFDFSSTVPVGKKILPILKKYPNNPGNGIDSVLVNRTRLGARYQGYSLSWNTAPNEIPPGRKSDDGLKQYPRSWNKINKYKFNPSRYSGTVQTSYICLVHPEEGERGYLKGAIGFNPVNLNSSELRIRKEDISGRVYDVYQCMPLSAVSPLTKRPSTHFYSVGVGIYKGEVNITNPVVVNPNDTTPPSDVTEMTTQITPRGVQVKWVNPTDSDFDGVEIIVDGALYASGVREVESYVLDLSVGTHTVKVVAVDKSGNKSAGVQTSVTV